LPADLKGFVGWLAATGMRKGEASLLRWEMVQGNELQIPATICKNGMARTIPLDGELAEIIERRRQVRTAEVNGTAQMCPLIFHRGGESTGEFKKSWKTACKKANCLGHLVHDLRRFAVRNLLHAQVPIPVAKVMEWA